MDWETLGIIGQFAASLAVIASLFYLALQVRHAKHEISLVGLQARANHANSVLAPLINSPEMAEIFAKLEILNFGDYGLSREESVRFGAWFHTWLQTEQASFYLLPAGSNDSLLKWMLSTPAGLEFWEKNKGIYDEPFVRRVESLKAELKQRPQSETDILGGG